MGDMDWTFAEIIERCAYGVNVWAGDVIGSGTVGTGCFLELNAHPERLDLLDIYCQMAKEEKVLIAINSDAHSIHEFDNLKYGVGQARRGWLEKDDILNTRSLKALQKLLKNKQ